jgi:hypothetical protein
LQTPFSRYASCDYAVTQAIAAAAFFLNLDGLIVPSARCAELNLAFFTEKLEPSIRKGSTRNLKFQLSHRFLPA